ncbi:hypothetical protein MSAN_00526600 [Mycena sanguinolenta]|uniref:NACHT domain-containing protein n=1 Tax=Mycena sanguinolenta TaxID=230812 RepID=A0A8H7DG66_9AGAR|nr:hypothetical protein MSAN_00526600 [Mycena sanguinolenta]
MSSGRKRREGNYESINEFGGGRGGSGGNGLNGAGGAGGQGMGASLVVQTRNATLHNNLRVDPKDFRDAVKQLSQPHNASAPYPQEDMPSPHRIFYGRKALVNEITSLLATEKTSRVCITGVGGMGKTSVALAVAERAIQENIFLKEYIFWVPCVEAKSPDLLRCILYAQLRITAETYDGLEPLIAELDASKRRRLLLLDNFETPWLSSNDSAKVCEILVRLAKLPHIALLVTMTSGFTPGDIEWQHRPLAPLDSPAARDAFKRKYQDAAGGHELIADGPELDDLLASIGHIPLAITLTAASGGCLGISPDDLLRDWREEGTGMMSGNQTRSMDDTIRLSMERGIVKSSPEALTLLAILSMLPAGTTGSNLEWWAPALTSSRRHAAVKILRIAALIEQDHGPFATSRIFVRPTIQSYMSHQGRIPAEVRNQVHDACYAFILRHKSIPDDQKFKSDLEAIASEEINIQGLLMEIPVDAPRPNAVDALIAFSLYQSRTKPSTVVASHALEVARSVYNDPHVADRDAAARRVAAAHQSLGKSLFMLDRYDEARLHFEEAAARFKHLPDGADLRNAGEASMDLLDTWMYIGTKHSPELEPLAREAQAHLSHDETDKYHVARGLLGFGHFLWWSHRPDETLEILSAAKALFEELGCPASTAECLYHIGRGFAWHRGDYAKALSIMKKAVEKAEQSGKVALICDILNATVGYLIILGSYQEASNIFTRFLSLAQAIGSPAFHCLEAREELAITVSMSRPSTASDIRAPIAAAAATLMDVSSPPVRPSVFVRSDFEGRAYTPFARDNTHRARIAQVPRHILLCISYSYPLDLLLRISYIRFARLSRPR